MKASNFYLMLAFLWLGNCFKLAHAQDEADTEALVDRFLPDAEEESDLESMIDLLYQYYQQPINLNKCTRQELADLQLLSEGQLAAFFDYRNRFGNFISLLELQAVPGFDPSTIHKILPFVHITEKQSAQSFWQRVKEEKNKYFFVRYQSIPEQKRGYRSDEGNGYLGSNARLLYRLRMSHTKDFSLGFTLEKDAGERLRWSRANKTYLSDFISWHYTRYNLGKLKALSLGDYQIQVGQGLLLAGGFQLGKGAETVQGLRRSTRGVIPFTSAAEFGYLRGGAATLEVAKNTQLTTFFSSKNLSANIKTDSIIGDHASSISQSGLHRTATELGRKQSLSEISGGYHLNYKLPFLEIGTTGLFTQYGLPIQRRPSDYNQFEFAGQRLINTGFNYSFYWQNFSFFGEAALSQGKYLGLISGVLAGFGKHAELAFVYRNYHRGFHSVYGNALSEGTRANNERGLYWGIKLKPFKKWTLAAYYDNFQFPWLRYQADAPSSGFEYLARLGYKPNRQLRCYLQYRFENRERNLKDNTTAFDFLVPVVRKDWRFNLDYKASKQISLRSRIQYSERMQGNLYSEGFALMQDIVWDFGKLRVAARAAFFDTDDYDTRQYAYEKDVLYAFSIPAYYGEGVRNYLLLKWRPIKNIDLWARYAITRWYDRNTVGSGLEEIDGPRRSEIKLQMRCKF